MIDRE